MKTALATVASGIAASYGFWLLDNVLLKFEGSTRVAGMATAFFLFSAVTYFLMQKDGSGSRRVLSDQVIDGDSEIRSSAINVKGGGSADLLSGNRIKGKSQIDIDRIDVG